MSISKAWPIVTLCSALCAIPVAANAQQAAPAGKETPPPSKTEKFEEGETPAITISPEDKKNRITEKRAEGGKVTEVEVKSGKSTYYLKPNDQVGPSQQGDAESTPMRGGTQWKIMTFGPNKAQQQPKDDPGLPPPAPPAAEKK